MNAKETMALMQIEAELAATLAKMTTLSQYITPKSESAEIIKKLMKDIEKAQAALGAQ